MVSGAGQAQAYGMVVLAEAVRPQQNDPQFRKDVEQQLTALLSEVNAGLPPYEKLQMIVVAKEPWTIENGSLTPTMKIKRSRIEANVGPKVESWYSSKGPVLWA
jgi:long-subunit acyl-CoA synthetase (AMP-forming)